MQKYYRNIENTVQNLFLRKLSSHVKGFVFIDSLFHVLLHNLAIYYAINRNSRLFSSSSIYFFPCLTASNLLLAEFLQAF